MAASETSQIVTSSRAENRGVIKYNILFHMAFKNLFSRRLRTALTVLGVVIGIGAIVFLLSFGFGLQDLVSRQVIGSRSVQTVDVSSPRSKVLKLNDEAISRVSGLGDVKDVGKSYSTAGKIKSESSQTETVVFAADRTFVDLSSLKFIEGKVFSKGDTREIIINQPLSRAIGITETKKAIGKSVKLTFDLANSDSEKRSVTKDFKIVGVYESDVGVELFMDSKVITDEGMGDMTQLKVVVASRDAVPDVRKGIESFGFATTSPIDTLNQINQVFTLLNFILIGFGGIGMVIAILGMFNTLTISLIERTREIGLMVSLGARKQDVRRLFITEALMLSVMGGFFGIMGAMVLGIIGNFALTSYARSNGVTESIRAFILSPGLALATLTLSATVGLVVVYFPARRAAQINPIEALRSE